MPCKRTSKQQDREPYLSSHVTLHDFAICRFEFFDQALLILLQDGKLIVQLQKVTSR